MGMMSETDKALSRLSSIYHIIVLANLTTDTHIDIKLSEEDMTANSGYAEKLSDWFYGVAKVGGISEVDKEKYLQFTDLDRLRNIFKAGETYCCCRFRQKINGDYRWVSLELAPAATYSHDDQQVYLYVKDIQDEFSTEIGEKDLVTGGFNRRGFFSKAQNILSESNEQQKFAIIVFDMIGFKAINELFGSKGGDALLHEIRSHIRNSSLKPILVGRLHGDHFACLLEQEHLNYDELSSLCKYTFTYERKALEVDIRCGIYFVEDKSLRVRTMCDYARIAKKQIVDLYMEPYAIFNPSMRVDYILQSEVRGRILEALENNEFKIYYQPIYDAQSGVLASAEALIRWHHPDKGMISPGIFIPVLEESGHVSKLDHFVAEHVAKYLQKRAEEGKITVPISVNLSWMDFYDKKMMKSIIEQVRNNKNPNIPPRFEITETSYAALRNREEEAIASLRDAGSKLLLDDFGSGYSSFSTIRDYSFDIAKLDMGFVQQIGKGEKIKSIIHSIIDMFHHMNVKVIAEGVENETQLDFLRRHGCDYIQGFYFSKPLPQDEFEKLLDKNEIKKF